MSSSLLWLESGDLQTAEETVRSLSQRRRPLASSVTSAVFPFPSVKCSYRFRGARGEEENPCFNAALCPSTDQ